MIETHEEIQKHEYIRHFGDMRFKQLTLLMGFMSVAVGGMAAVGNKDVIPNMNIRLVISVIGILFTSMLWIMEVRSTVVWSEVRSAIKVTWPFYNYFFPPLINATSAVLGFYMTIYAFWGYCLFGLASKAWVYIAVILIFILLTTISFFNYRHCIKIQRKT